MILEKQIERQECRKRYFRDGSIQVEEDVLYITKFGKFGIIGQTLNNGQYIEYYNFSGDVFRKGHYSLDKRIGLWEIFGDNRFLLFFYVNNLVEGESQQIEI